MGVNLFELAEVQLLREGQEPSRALILDRAITIRKWFDKHRGVANRILAGGRVYQYGNRFIVTK